MHFLEISVIWKTENGVNFTWELLLQHFHQSIVINLAMKNLPLILRVWNLNFVDFSGSW